jgi:putative colanic acid biosysnthesis UDP-glucose lipid carrier transferase
MSTKDGVHGLPLDNPGNRFLKRLFDIFFSLAAIVLLLWWFLPLVALFIRIGSKGNPFFIQKRSGLNKKTFDCYKLRSMRPNELADIKQAVDNDERVTKLGCCIRKWNVDEFPQFFNVLKGDMSVVGPRPHMLKHTEQYSSQIPGYMNRLSIKPGITGWAQIHGFHGTTEELWRMESRVAYDRWYIRKWSFGLDIFIVLQTFLFCWLRPKNGK